MNDIIYLVVHIGDALFRKFYIEVNKEYYSKVITREFWSLLSPNEDFERVDIVTEKEVEEAVPRRDTGEKLNFIRTSADLSESKSLNFHSAFDSKMLKCRLQVSLQSYRPVFVFISISRILFAASETDFLRACQVKNMIIHLKEKC